jgi:Tc5 transposase DNA-binding domain
LYEWQKRIGKKGLFTSGELIIARARQIRHQLPEPLDQPIPSFSVGWLANSKKRHSLKQRIQHGEAGSIDEEAAEGKMVIIRVITTEYSEEDIYSMVKQGCF